MKNFLLLLFLLIPIALLGYYCTHKMNAASTIQSDINTRAQAALDEQNLGWANLVVDGRDITLTGSAPNEAAKDAADQAVRINGYNLIDNQLTIAGGDSVQQNSDQNNSPQTDAKDTKQPEEQASTDSDEQTADDAQKAENTPTEETPEKQDNTQETKTTEAAPAKQSDTQEASVKQAIASKDCQKKFNKILKTPIYFKSSSDSVQKKSVAVLNKLALAAEECASFNLVVHGHSDSTGKASLNKKLSHGRAKMVMKYLIKQKIDSKRLTAQGHGSSKPIASNKTNTGRARNRRIEITIEDKQ
jgi:outer membrane protein OmpA-like peptidoglycan-associated protein